MFYTVPTLKHILIQASISPLDKPRKNAIDNYIQKRLENQEPLPSKEETKVLADLATNWRSGIEWLAPRLSQLKLGQKGLLPLSLLCQRAYQRVTTASFEGRIHSAQSLSGIFSDYSQNTFFDLMGQIPYMHRWSQSHWKYFLGKEVQEGRKGISKKLSELHRMASEVREKLRSKHFKVQLEDVVELFSIMEEFFKNFSHPELLLLSSAALFQEAKGLSEITNNKLEGIELFRYFFDCGNFYIHPSSQIAEELKGAIDEFLRDVLRVWEGIVSLIDTHEKSLKANRFSFGKKLEGEIYYFVMRKNFQIMIEHALRLNVMTYTLDGNLIENTLLDLVKLLDHFLKMSQDNEATVQQYVDLEKAMPEKYKELEKIYIFQRKNEEKSSGSIQLYSEYFLESTGLFHGLEHSIMQFDTADFHFYDALSPATTQMLNQWATFLAKPIQDLAELKELQRAQSTILYPLIERLSKPGKKKFVEWNDPSMKVVGKLDQFSRNFNQGSAIKEITYSDREETKKISISVENSKRIEGLLAEVSKNQLKTISSHNAMALNKLKVDIKKSTLGSRDFSLQVIDSTLLKLELLDVERLGIIFQQLKSAIQTIYYSCVKGSSDKKIIFTPIDGLLGPERIWICPPIKLRLNYEKIAPEIADEFVAKAIDTMRHTEKSYPNDLLVDVNLFKRKIEVIQPVAKENEPLEKKSDTLMDICKNLGVDEVFIPKVALTPRFTLVSLGLDWFWGGFSDSMRENYHPIRNEKWLYYWMNDSDKYHVDLKDLSEWSQIFLGEYNFALAAEKMFQLPLSKNKKSQVDQKIVTNLETTLMKGFYPMKVSQEGKKELPVWHPIEIFYGSLMVKFLEGQVGLEKSKALESWSEKILPAYLRIFPDRSLEGEFLVVLSNLLFQKKPIVAEALTRFSQNYSLNEGQIFTFEQKLAYLAQEENYIASIENSYACHEGSYYIWSDEEVTSAYLESRKKQIDEKRCYIADQLHLPEFISFFTRKRDQKAE